MKRSFYIRFLPLILTFSMAFGITTPAAAQGLITGDTIPAGTVVFTLLRAVPYVGWVFDILFTAAGMGAAWIAYRDSSKKPEPVREAIPVKKATQPPVKK